MDRPSRALLSPAGDSAAAGARVTARVPQERLQIPNNPISFPSLDYKLSICPGTT